MRQFAGRKVGLTTVATIMIALGPMGAITLLSPMVLQLPEDTSIGHGLSPTTAGALQLVLSAVCYSGAWASGRIAQLFGARWSLVTACLLYITGTGLWFFATDSLIATVLCLGLVLMGSNASLPALSNLIVEAVPAEQTGAATGMNRVALNVGVAAGTSVTSVILSFWTVSGTNLPTPAALSAGFVFVIGTALA
ncbi:MFS transporter, partial [Actinomadura adrarensis]